MMPLWIYLAAIAALSLSRQPWAGVIIDYIPADEPVYAEVCEP